MKMRGARCDLPTGSRKCVGCLTCLNYILFIFSWQVLNKIFNKYLVLYDFSVLVRKIMLYSFLKMSF